MRLRLATLSLITLSLSCADSTGPGDGALAIESMWTPPAPLFAGVALPSAPRVRVVNAAGNPIANVQVAFTVLSGGGTTNNTAATTGANGEASVVWTLGMVAGVQELRATLPSDTGAASVTFSAEVIYGPPATLSLNLLASSLTVGTVIASSVTTRDAGGLTVSAPGPFTYASLDESVATVSATGVVTAVAVGTTSIVVNSGSITGARPVTVHNGTPVFQRTDAPGQASLGVAVTVNRRVLIAGSSSTQIRSFDSETGAALPSITTATATRDIAVRPDGARALATAISGPNNVYELDLTTNTVARTFTLPHRGVRVVYSADGQSGFVTNDNGVLYRIDLNSEAITSVGLPMQGFINGLAMSRDGSTIAATGFSGTTYLVSTADLNVGTHQVGGVLQGVDFSMDGSRIFVAKGEDGVVRRYLTATMDWDAATVSRGHYDVRLSPDGRFLFATGPSSNLLRVYRPATLELLLEVNLGAELNRIAFDAVSGAAWISTTGAQLTRITLF